MSFQGLSKAENEEFRVARNELGIPFMLETNSVIALLAIFLHRQQGEIQELKERISALESKQSNRDGEL